MAAQLGDICFADIMTFLSVRRYGSISGAARELNVTPSQVSKAVVRLEEQLGLTLLSRGSRGVSINEAGRRIVPQLEDLVARLQGLRRQEAPQAPEITVAAPSYLNAIFLPIIAESQPQLRVRGLELPPALVRAYAAENFFDLTVTVGLSRLPKPWVSEQIGELRKALFTTPETAKQLGKAPVTPEALRALPFVSPVYYANGTFVAVDDGCPLGHGDRGLGHEATTFALALELALRSNQLLFGPAIAARAYLLRNELVEVPVKGWDVKEPLHLACNSERVLARVQSAVLKAFRGALERLQ